MTGTAAKRQRTDNPGTTDERLIQQCLKGDQEAWSALIDKYKNLIYSIPIKYGMYQDAGDIFQAVCVDLLLELPKIREYRALPKWLMQTCYHKCLRYQQAAKREVELEPTVAEQLVEGDPLPEQMLAQLTEEQALRNVVSQMSDRCQQMIHMLFFEIPARPYEEIAKALGLATGSIGFIRGRCLSQLRKQLEKKGF
ncbi:MAG TPA: sigma-70 family RNA polymerase sigma factor [Terriglobales bacterium]|jgi:RNA polymerase sigma factor (sigma-70 family)